MRFEILDVGHGFCAYVLADNGNVMLFDSGHKSDPEFRPSQYLRRMGITAVERFFVTNYDEDHVSDLPGLRRQLPITILSRNKTIDAQQLRALKLQAGPITPAMQELLNIMETYNSPVTNPPEFPGIAWQVFHNRYKVDFDDTNNISQVVFLHMVGSRGRVDAVISGDVEAAGWEKLLGAAAFRQELSTVKVFVASHHGRESGYCEDVFRYCHPDVVVFSDGPLVYGTQDMSSTYAQHAKGVPFNGELRKVLTTRQDGSLTWNL